MLVKSICPQCNGQMEVDDSSENIVCPYCGTKIINMKQKLDVSGTVKHDVSGTVRHVLDRSNEPNLYISYGTTNPAVNMVTKIASTGQKNTLVNGQTASFHLTKGRQDIVLKIGKKNYNRTIVIPDDNSPVRINASYSGRANISIDQPTVTNADGSTQVIRSQKGASAMSVIAFILSLTIYGSPIGLILGILDKVKGSEEKSHRLTIPAIVIGGIFTFSLLFAIISGLFSSGQAS